MSKILIAVAVGAVAAFSLAPQPAQARHCSMVTATAPGVTQGIATRKADRRLRRYATHRSTAHLPGLGGGAKPPPILPKLGYSLQIDWFFRRNRYRTKKGRSLRRAPSLIGWASYAAGFAQPPA